MTETYYQLPAVMLVPNRPGRAPSPPSGEEDLERWAAEANDSFSDLARWAQQIHSAIFDSYIPQTDRIENMIMVGTGTAERPAPIGSRRFYYDLATRILYLDVRDGDTEAWEVVFSSEGAIVVLDTSNFGKVLGPSDGNLQDAMDTIDDHIHAAEEITVDVAGFGGILGALDDEVQHALDTLDDLSHSDLPDVGTYDHGDIDNHIDDDTIHFLESSIAHGNIQDVGFYTHYEIDEHIDDDTIHFLESEISHLNIQDIGVHDHADIDSHLYDLDFFHDHGNFSGLLDDDHTQYVLRSEWAQNGFVDRGDVALSWDDGTRTLTIQPAVTDFSYFLAGVKYTETGSITETIADTEGMWVFYIDAEGSMASVNNPSGQQVAQVIVDYTIVAYVYWDATNNLGKLMYELHGASMSPETHRYAHFTQRAQYVSGMAIAGLVTEQNGDDDEDAQLGVETGAFDDEDLYQTLAAIATGDPIEIWYRSGANGDWRWTETTISGESFPVIPFSGGSGRLAWNEFTGGAWQQTEVGNTDLVLCHIYATNIVDDGDSTKRKYIAIQGQNEYSTLGQARDGASVEINTLSYGTLPLEEVVPVATIIFQSSTGYSNKVKARTRTTDTGDDYVDWREATPQGGVPVGDHGGLSGLSDLDHPASAIFTSTTNFDGVLSVSETTVQAALDVLDDVCQELEENFGNYLLINGTVPLTADWDAGSFEIRAQTFESDVATGTAPLTIASTTVVANLNADLLDGNEAAAFAAAAHTHLEADITDLDHTDADAFHDDVAGEIAALTAADPVHSDHFLFEDVSDSNNKKRCTFERITRFDAYGRGVFIYVSNDSGSNMAKGDLCYISGDSSGVPQVTLANASAAATATGMLVVLYAAINNGADGWALAVGTINGFSSLTPGAIQYVRTVAGGFSQVAPSSSSQIVRVAGHAISATEIYFNPSNAWVEVA